MVSAPKAHELPSTSKEIGPNLCGLRMILERKSLQGVDMLCSAELGDLQFYWEQAQVFAIEIQIAAVETLVFRACYSFLLLAKVVSDTSRLMCSRTNGVDQGIWLEESPEQVIRDVAGR